MRPAVEPRFEDTKYLATTAILTPVRLLQFRCRNREHGHLTLRRRASAQGSSRASAEYLSPRALPQVAAPCRDELKRRRQVLGALQLRGLVHLGVGRCKQT